MMVVYSLLDAKDFFVAADELRKTAEDIPADWKLIVCKRNDPEVGNALIGVPYGSIVQIIEMPDNTQEQDFLSTDAYRSQKQRTKGRFSQISSIYCPLEDSDP